MDYTICGKKKVLTFYSPPIHGTLTSADDLYA
jgi:hypothetical protein